MKRLAAVSVLALLLSGCVQPPAGEPGQPSPQKQLSKKQLQSEVDKLSNCEKINALIEGQPKGFPQLRGAYTRTPYGDIWQARYDLVGKGCEVWRGGAAGSYSYVCHRAAPDRDSGDLYYNAANQIARNCLSSEWQAKEEPRKIGVGLKTVFSKPGTNTIVAVHLIRTDGVFDNQWAIYYMVGIPNDRL